MDISIIFVNYKTKDLTINAIKSVMEKTEGLEYEIFVVDNNSSDGSIEAIEQQFNGIVVTNSSPLPFSATGEERRVYIIKSKINGGFGYANNLAIKQASGKYIFCLNTDTLLVNNAIKIMYDFMEEKENKNVGVCGGYIIDNQNKPSMCGGNFPSLMNVILKFGFRDIFKTFYKKKYGLALNSNEIRNRNIDYITGADIFFRKSVLDIVGMFDERFFMFYEETDLCKRINDAGYEIKFVKEAKIIHLEGKSSKNILQRKLYSKKSELLYFKKTYGTFLTKFVKYLYILLYLIAYLKIRDDENKELLNYMWRINIKHEI